MAQTKQKAIRFSKKAFGRGFQPINRVENLKEHIRKIKEGKESFILGMTKGITRLFFQWEYLKMFSRVKGYLYFQEFLPDNNCDIRIIVTANRAFALKRMTRKNDFRASGSGNIIYNPLEIDIRCVEIAFSINNKLKTQSIAYDFIFDENNNPLIVEISYNYDIQAYDNCPGYWDSDLKWNEGRFNPQYWQIENLVSVILNSKK